ncbi:MAG: hypothetical protein M3071_03485, partial [Actinomycetota bacterium]|nr:hypothetical protein [Actinomycetota bacterium]
TLDGIPTPDPPATLDPPLPAPGGRPTIHRLARRHDLEDEAPAQADERSRLGLAIAAVTAAIIVAAVVGAVLGSSGGTRVVTAKTTPTLSPATQAKQVIDVVKGVGVGRRPALRRLNVAGTASAQAAAAAAVEHAYANGVKKLAALPAVTRSAAPTQAIDRILKALARAYGSLEADARSLYRLHYASELRVIERDEQALRTKTRALR